MINIEIPEPDIIISQSKQGQPDDKPEVTPIYGFTDFHLIPRDKGGLILFYNHKDDLLFVGKARKLRQRVKKHFEDSVSPIKDHRDEVKKISICIVDEPMDRDIYETYIINTLQAKYNVDKVFY